MNRQLNNDNRRQQLESIYAQSKLEFSQVVDISAADLRALQASSNEIVLVDVRTPAEQIVSMLPGALTVEQFESAMTQYQHADVVVYCKTGYRSGHYAQRLMDRGFSNVRNLQGSILAWTHVGGLLVNESGATRKVNVLDPDNDLTAEGYEAVW